jgi:toxin ParE1/3/4
MAPYSVRFTPRAERQLSALYAYIADQSGEWRAEAFAGEIVADCLALANFPERGNRRDDIRPNLRIKGFRRRVSIAFSIDAARRVVAVHGVFYGGQDFAAVLGDIAGDD